MIEYVSNDFIRATFIVQKTPELIKFALVMSLYSGVFVMACDVALLIDRTLHLEPSGLIDPNWKMIAYQCKLFQCLYAYLSMLKFFRLMNTLFFPELLKFVQNI